MPRSVRAYRWAVLVLAAIFFVDRFGTERFTLESFGWQFRYLTIWALTLSLVSAAMMTTRAYGASDDRGAVFVSVTAAMNLLVVASYWRLALTDPSLVYGDTRVVQVRDLYLHLVGPALQVGDALFFKRAIRFARRTVAWVLALIVTYVLWAELVVAPLNDDPVGRVRTGLPYPFLNDMGLGARLRFYAATALAGACLVGVLRLVQAGVPTPPDRGPVR